MIVIVGGVILVVLITFIVVALVLCHKRRKRNRGRGKPTSRSNVEKGEKNDVYVIEDAKEEKISAELKEIGKEQQQYTTMPVKPEKKAGPVKPAEEANMLGIPNDFLVDYSKIQLFEKVGAGSTGTVYRGTLHYAEVAVKVVNSNFSKALRPKTVQFNEFVQEIQILRAMIPHPNVVMFRGVSVEPVALLTDYCAGGSLRKVLDTRYKELSEKQKFNWITDICKGMLHLHFGMKNHIIHRDLAARNIFLKNGNALIGDLGLARLKTSDEESFRTLHFTGAVKWLPPEAFLGNEYSRKTDIYSFGVLMWEILTGKEPWVEETPIRVSQLIVTGKRLPIPADTPTVLQNIMKACWLENPKDRPEFTDIMQALSTIDNTLLEEVKNVKHAPAPPPKAGRPLKLSDNQRWEILSPESSVYEPPAPKEPQLQVQEFDVGDEHSEEEPVNTQDSFEASTEEQVQQGSSSEEIVEVYEEYDPEVHGEDVEVEYIYVDEEEYEEMKKNAQKK